MMGISVRSFNEWDIKPYKKKGNQTFYDLKKVIKYYKDRNEKKISIISEQRANLIRIQSEKAELEFGEMSGRLLDSKVVETIWKDQIISFRSKLLSLPNRISLQLSKITSAKKIKSLITENVITILGELSEFSSSRTKIKRKLKKYK